MSPPWDDYHKEGARAILGGTYCGISLRAAQPTAANITIRDDWHQSLLETCNNESKPQYFLVTDNRGKRTAWTVYLKVGGSTYMADYWYDYDHLYNGFENAAENALRRQKVVREPPDTVGMVAWGSVWHWWQKK
ncbi:hypothetical protein VM1G_11311 [Cytospora mali]|uniref:Uncharacterized protein n=1 Tax=Cytospora mali TaxID=578113 RepID=A0A194VNV8_CYTMA|nr:hypothetical protein VM1G_11311 [Valsa mali]